jgi:hypothetical protein
MWSRSTWERSDSPWSDNLSRRHFRRAVQHGSPSRNKVIPYHVVQLGLIPRGTTDTASHGRLTIRPTEPRRRRSCNVGIRCFASLEASTRNSSGAFHHRFYHRFSSDWWSSGKVLQNNGRHSPRPIEHLMQSCSLILRKTTPSIRQRCQRNGPALRY